MLSRGGRLTYPFAAFFVAARGFADLMKIRPRVAGAGVMGFWHAEHSGVGGEVAAVFDVDDGAARRLASRCKGARACARLEDALERDKINVLHVARRWVAILE